MRIPYRQLAFATSILLKWIELKASKAVIEKRTAESRPYCKANFTVYHKARVLFEPFQDQVHRLILSRDTVSQLDDNSPKLLLIYILRQPNTYRLIWRMFQSIVYFSSSQKIVRFSLLVRISYRLFLSKHFRLKPRSHYLFPFGLFYTSFAEVLLRARVVLKPPVSSRHVLGCYTNCPTRRSKLNQCK